MEWQPIETAPKSGEFLVWHPTMGVSILVVPEREEPLPFEYGDTHWMPLPVPPQAVSGPDDALVAMVPVIVWVMPGDDTANDTGWWVDATITKGGEFTRPLCDARAALAVFREHDPLLAEAREALVKAQWALQPFSDRVFTDDNGDRAVEVGPVSADRFTDANFAYRRVRAVLRKLEGKP